MDFNGYELSRNIFDWSYENPEKINPNHIALYFFIIEHCNRLGWKEKFGLPTGMAKEAIGIRNYRTYIKTLNDLIDFGFIKLIEKSKNQYSCNIIAIVKNTKAHTKALDKARQKHLQKQGKSIDSIDKPINPKQENSDPHSFYKNEIEKNINSKYAKEYSIFYDLLNGKNNVDEVLENILRIPGQVSYKQFEKLFDKSKEKGKKFSNILLTMDNNIDYCKKRSSLSKTLHTWLNNDFK